MSARTDRHWARIGESTFVGGMWFLYYVYRVLGRLPFRICLYPVVCYYWAARGVARRASRQYLARLQAAHGAIGEKPTWRHEIRHFLRFAESLLDKLLAFTGRFPYEQVRLSGHEPLEAMAAEGRGCVVLIAHIGSLELCQAVAEKKRQIKLNVLAYTEHAARWNRLLKRLNPRSSVELLPVGELNAAMAVVLAEKVARGEVIAISCDRVPVGSSRTVRAPFLGHEANLPIGAYVIASLLQCPVYLMSCVREDQGYALSFEPIAERIELPRKGRDAALTAYAARFAARLEALLVRAPYDWFNFFPFWDQAQAVSSSESEVSHEQPSV